MASGQSTEKNPSDPTVGKFDAAMANYYASEKRWDALKDYMRKFCCQDTEAVFANLAALECKAIDCMNEGNYSSANVLLVDDILPLLATSKREVGSLADHLYFFQIVVNISMSPMNEASAEQYGVTRNLIPESSIPVDGTSAIPSCGPTELPVSSPQRSQFDPATANLFVASKNWDGLCRYLGLLNSKESDSYLKLFVEPEYHAIQLIQDGKPTEALSALQFLKVQCNGMETAKFLEHLVFFQESLCVFDEEVVRKFFNDNDVDGMKLYVGSFLQNLNDAVNQHPLLELIILQIQLAVASKEKNKDKSEILKFIDDLKNVSEGSKFVPSDLGARIAQVKSQEEFNDDFLEGRLSTLLNYFRLYFRKYYRPMLCNDDTVLRFCEKLKSGRLRCLACGHTFPKDRGEATIGDHLARSAARASKKKMCDAITPRLNELLEESLASGGTGLKRKREQTISDPRSPSKITTTKDTGDSFSGKPFRNSCGTGASTEAKLKVDCGN